MRTSNASATSSRQWASTARRASRATTAVRSPRWSCVSTTASPNRRWSSARIATRSVPLRLGGDLVLQLQEPGTEAVDVVVRARRRHVLHPAAGGHERVLEDRVLPGPPDGLVELAGEEAAYSHSRPPLRQTYANPSIRTPRNTSISPKPNQPSFR